MMTELQTGPELDRLIAEKVMGWTHCASLNGGEWYEVDGKFTGMKPYNWYPSTSIADAWQVVERMRGKDWCVRIALLGDEALCSIITGIGTQFERFLAEESADTPPLAICRAALMAVEAQ